MPEPNKRDARGRDGAGMVCRPGLPLNQPVPRHCALAHGPAWALWEPRLGKIGLQGLLPPTVAACLPRHPDTPVPVRVAGHTTLNLTLPGRFWPLVTIYGRVTREHCSRLFAAGFRHQLARFRRLGRRLCSPGKPNVPHKTSSDRQAQPIGTRDGPNCSVPPPPGEVGGTGKGQQAGRRQFTPYV